MQQYRDFFIDLDADLSIKSYFEGKEKKGGKLELGDELKKKLREFLDPDPEEKWEKNQVVNFGDDLRKALLKGEVENQFDSALKIVSEEKLGLRIVLRIDPEYAGYPWEAMSKKETPLSIDTKTPIVRGLKGANSSINLGDKPLRILVVASEPMGTPGIDAKGEISKIQKAIGEEPFKPDVVDRGTRSNIDQKIQKKNYNIIHFIGHGNFDAEKQKGYLLLMKENGRRLPADETKIKNIFLNQPEVGLMILNACNTAQESKELGGGLVPKLIERVPVIISMRGRVSSDASAAFSHACYLSLSARSKTIEEIVCEARRTMFTNDYEFKDWRDFSIPVLFMGLGKNGAKPAVVTSKFGTLFQKVMGSEKPTAPTPLSEEGGPAVKVLRDFVNTVWSDVHHLRNLVEECVVTLDDSAESKGLRKQLVKEARKGSDALKEHVDELCVDIHSEFQDTYGNIAETRVSLEGKITELKDCFVKIAEHMKEGEKAMNCIRGDVEKLYVQTVKGILEESLKKESLKRKTEGPGR